MSSRVFFLGGTALRFLYRIRRFSEDLDFSAGLKWSSTDLNQYIKKFKRELLKAGYQVKIKVEDQKVVQKARIIFDSLLFEAGMVQRENQKFTIHLEIDLNPPQDWQSKKTVVNLFQPVLLHHYDLPSMFAGKIHAVLTRGYTKGRDIFWYRSRWQDIIPNFIMLNNALTRTGGEHPQMNTANWQKVLSKKIASLNWEEVSRDVSPFIEYHDDLLTFTRENLLSML